MHSCRRFRFPTPTRRRTGRAFEERQVEAVPLRRHRQVDPPAAGAQPLHRRPRCTSRTSADEGAVYSYIVVRQALVPGRVPPYVVALIELAEQPGLRINAVLDADPADVRIGQRVVRCE